MIGAIGRHKGLDLLVSMMDEAAERRLSVFLTVIGYTADDERLTLHGNVEVTGRYKPDELGTLLRAADPDFVFLSSVWPETYSYVLSEVWAAGYPVVAFDFGAPAERIRASGGGILIPPTRDARDLLRTLLEVEPQTRSCALPPPPVQVDSLDAYYAPVERARGL